MAAMGRVLAALAELERRYDGPIPAPLRSLAGFGSIERVSAAEAEREADFFTGLVRGQIVALRHWRRYGIALPGLEHDFALYWRRRRWWRREAARWRGTVMPSAGGIP
jgi:hypothetical protein